MIRRDIAVIPEYFKRYVEQIPSDSSVIQALETFGPQSLEKDLSKLEALGDRVYAENKWTVNQILVHLIDAERVFAYRALRFSRGDETELNGFDENDYAAAANVSHRNLDDIMDEFKSLRASTISMYKSLNDNELSRSGMASGKEVSVLALGYMISGHVAHHQHILEERYYPLLNQ